MYLIQEKSKINEQNYYLELQQFYENSSDPCSDFSFSSINEYVGYQSQFGQQQYKCDLFQPQKTSNLQISNYTGSAITSQMASVFIKFINEAYHLYTNDIIQNCEYIKNKLQGTYSSLFQVLIYPENSTAGASIYTTQLGKAYVTWSKVNTKKPLWTYIIIALPTTTTKRDYAYLNGVYQAGYGFTSSFQHLLERIVKQVQTESKCKCSTDQVETYLYLYLQYYKWNVVCSSSKDMGAGGFQGIIYHTKYLYEQTLELTPGRCRYLVWAI